MPVFQETSHADRELRILPSIARPVPRLSARDGKHTSSDDCFEVIVIGAGPAGLFLTLNLARLGLRDDSLLCLDSKPGTLKAGQADGLQPRTLEVLKSLGVADEILNEGCHMTEVAFWNPKEQVNGASKEVNGKLNGAKGIERTNFVPDVIVAARFKHEVTIHQGRIERILEENLRLYSSRSVVRSHHFVNFRIDPAGNATYPVEVEVEQELENGERKRKVFRTKHLVGGDGAHSKVRRAMDLKLEGDTTDIIWGVADFVCDTDFPDIRKRSAIHSDAGSVMVIPRERIASGEYLTRLYVQVKDDEVEPAAEEGLHKVKEPVSSRERRAAITLDYILEQAQKVFSPYHIRVKKGAVVDWWAAYQIGQRMAPDFSLKDSEGVERVFIVGDACHTHSPKAGQGMNVSMMDSYNLAWKLVHSIHGITPKSSSKTDPVLATFNQERVSVAAQLIEFDRKFSSMFSGQIGTQDPDHQNLTHDQFLKVFSDGSGFTSGCGIEYGGSVLVHPDTSSAGTPGISQDYLQGAVKTGRRLCNTRVQRYADANPRNLQDDFLSTGRYRILVLASTNLLEPQSSSASAIKHICEKIIPSFPAETIELVAIHPLKSGRFEWTDLPPCLKEYAEMSFHGPGEDDPYEIYGIPHHRGAIIVVRPDGYVGMMSQLTESDAVLGYFKGCLVTM